MRPTLLWLILALLPGASLAGQAAVPEAASGAGRDPLRAELPSEALYMQVPGGALAVTMELPPEAPIEAVRAARHGGFVVGYCLKSSCRYVTHLAVLQVCGNRVEGGGASGERGRSGGGEGRVLALVKLPYGAGAGWIKALDGEGPSLRPLAAAPAASPNALLALQAVAAGPAGSGPAVDLAFAEGAARGFGAARVEVRHRCEAPLS